MFLHLYQNDSDEKEHLAIVFGNSIRSKSLDAERPNETEMDRMIRGAYIGRLRPGRVSSRVDNSESHRRAIDRRRRAGSSALRNVETPETVVEHEELRINSNTTSAQTPPQQPPSPTDPDQSLHADMDSLSLHNDSPHLTTPPLVRIHSECYTGETAWSARCDCGEQLDEAARLMSLPSCPEGGVIVYLRQEGRGIGLASKLKAYNLQDLGNDTVEANLLLRHPADARTYGLATAILVDLGCGEEAEEVDGFGLGIEQQSSEQQLSEQSEQHKQQGQKKKGGLGIRLLTNNPDKVRAVEGPNKEVRVRERVAMVPLAWRTGGQRGVKGVEIERYLDTKIRQMGHMIHE